MLARRFLWIVAIIIMIVIAAAFAYRLFGVQLIRAALVPGGSESKEGACAKRAASSGMASWMDSS
jgi:hypothetical protein